MPLYHFVTDDLPLNTIAPELDDSNAVSSLAEDVKWSGVDRTAGAAVNERSMGQCLSYLIAIGFMPPPAREGKNLPTAGLTESQREAKGKIGGRGRTK